METSISTINPSHLGELLARAPPCGKRNPTFPHLISLKGSVFHFPVSLDNLRVIHHFQTDTHIRKEKHEISELSIAGWWFGTWILWLSIQFGISSSQLTFTPWFFRGVGLNHQPVMLNPPTSPCLLRRWKILQGLLVSSSPATSSKAPGDDFAGRRVKGGGFYRGTEKGQNKQQEWGILRPNKVNGVFYGSLAPVQCNYGLLYEDVQSIKNWMLDTINANNTM